MKEKIIIWLSTMNESNAMLIIASSIIFFIVCITSIAIFINPIIIVIIFTAIIGFMLIFALSDTILSSIKAEYWFLNLQNKLKSKKGNNT